MGRVGVRSVKAFVERANVRGAWVEPTRRVCVGASCGLILLAMAGTFLPEAAAVARGETAAPPTTITYRILSEGRELPEEGKLVVTCDDRASRVRLVPAAPLAAVAPAEEGWIDFSARRTLQTASLRDGARVSYATPFEQLAALDETAELDTILGIPCRKATTVIRSNRIDCWYAQEIGLKGSPSLSVVAPDGLVLRIVRNGNYEIVAESIVRGAEGGAGENGAAGDGMAEERVDASPLALPSDWGEMTDAAGYRALVTESWITTVQVFEREPVRFDGAAPKRFEPDERGIFHAAGGTLIARKVTLPDLPDAMVFAELVEASRGDAYDRTGSVAIIPVDRARSFLDALRDSVGVLPAVPGRDGRSYQGIALTPDYLPPIELMRFITPFGVRHYNEQVSVRGSAWADSAGYRMDVTDLLPALRGEVWIVVFVGNYDAGGHEISLTLRYYPNRREESPPPAELPWLLPLCNTLNLLEMAGQEYGRIFEHDTLEVEFEVPAGVGDLHLRYLTTGHGGWGGGDEFNPKVNTILIDGQVAAAIAPWRSDCATFRALNPASGNFWNGLSSSDFSRSGWCPGTTVSPHYIPLPDLGPGRHRLEIAIPAGAPEGGSFSAWNVSAVVMGTAASGE